MEALIILKGSLQDLNLEIQEERCKLFVQLYSIISQWQGDLPNLRLIFQSNEIDWFLTEAITNEEISIDVTVTFVNFVISTGYKDQPERDESVNPSTRRVTPIHHASRKNLTEIVHKLFSVYDNFDVNYIDESGLTHCHVACMFGLENYVQKFLKHGQDPNHLVGPPLHLSLAYRCERVARVLLSNGR
ncbi:unnamed protein product [Trichogramma brassicae]|uniref:Uncharacterized protein n=1 Tax=Trichogramma brassicae TaxID=86971 RepID=A0A6H5IB30_9HYME|nr:unnamed protein product [Trichogramma brassicae]